MLKKTKMFLVTLVLVRYSLLGIFFLLQGHAIELSIAKDRAYYSLGLMLLFYAITKIMVMLCDIFQIFLIEYFKNMQIRSDWEEYFPKRIYRDIADDSGRFYILFFDYLPKIFDLKSGILINYCTIVWVILISFFLFSYTNFYYGIIAMMLIFILSYISKIMFVKNIEKLQQELNDNKNKIILWLNQYFSGYKEISKNWHVSDLVSWSNEVYYNYYQKKYKYNLLYLYRDVTKQFLIELPFIINSVLIISSVYYGILSLTQMFVWIGMAQFMINASNSYFDNKSYKNQIKTLSMQADTIINKNKYSSIFAKSHDKNISNLLPSEVLLSDGSNNSLDLKPGIYPVHGSNGSGKTTLLNIILGYERKLKIQDNRNFDHLIKKLNQSDIRIIERDAVLFDHLKAFSLQVQGPNGDLSQDWEYKINNIIFQLFSNRIAEQWINVFTSLELKYNNREDKSFSSGEKVILSFMRFINGWTSAVKLLIVDECEAFLDKNNQQLFKSSIDELAAKMAVYICSQDVKGVKAATLSIMY